MSLQGHIPGMPFRQWLWGNRENRWLLCLSGIAVLVQFTWYKQLYPYPNFLPDSYSYLDAAYHNKVINMWPVGYSRFLRLFSCFTHWDTALIFFQYAFLQASVLYLLFTVRYWLAPNKRVTCLLFAASMLNPMLLPVSNFISSDALFAALSIIWFTQLLWIMYAPGLQLLAVHALVLLPVFMTRYNALYYPAVSLALVAWSSWHTMYKIMASLIIVVAIGGFIWHTMLAYQEKTGAMQFSAFGGWQLASNALFAYAHVRPLQQQVPAEFSQLHTITNRHMDSIARLQHRPDSALGIYYLWDDKAPLKRYMAEKYRYDSTTGGFERWASMAGLYARYGAYLVRSHPAAFLRYYILPNMKNYYSPSPEFLAIYNMGSDKVGDLAKTWFHYKTGKVYAATKNRRIAIAAWWPVLLAVTNLAFLSGFVGCMMLGGFRKSTVRFNQALRCLLLVWGCNFAFSVLASPVVLRYQVFPMVVTLVFMVLLMAYIAQESREAGNSMPVPQVKDEVWPSAV